MPRILPTITEAALKQLKQDSPLLWLYEFESRDINGDPERFRIVNARQDVPFGSGDTLNVFQRWPVVHGGIETSSSGEQSSVRVTAALDREFKIRDALERNNGLRGYEAIVHVVRFADAGNVSAAISFPFKVKGCAPSPEGGVQFRLSTENFFKKKLPRWRYSRSACFRTFGDEGCGYVIPTSPTNTIGGGFSTCPRIQSACDIRGQDEEARGLDNNHPARIGAFPGMLNEPVR